MYLKNSSEEHELVNKGSINSNPFPSFHNFHAYHESSSNRVSNCGNTSNLDERINNTCQTNLHMLGGWEHVLIDGSRHSLSQL